MRSRQRIFILGNSLLLNALGDNLQRSGCFDLTSLEMPHDLDALLSLKPDAILFDLETPYMESIFTLSDRCSKLLLIGVSPDTNIVKLWAGRHLRELSMQSLLDAITDQLNVDNDVSGTSPRR